MIFEVKSNAVSFGYIWFPAISSNVPIQQRNNLT